MVLQEILDWSQTLPLWQRDALRRLLASDEIGHDDLDDIFALLKLEHNIADPKGRKASPLTQAHIPIPPKDGTEIRLIAIKDLKNVNAIAEGQRLPIQNAGLTVVYGDNGSGKSGYSRLLKKACRARDQSETIHPNANLPANKVGAAEGVFEIEIDGTAKDFPWKVGELPPPELSALSIFDSRCARAYLDKEDDFSFVPFGLDLFERLVRICDKLKEMVTAESARHSPNLVPFSHLAGETEVGKVVSGLNAKTSAAKIEALATLNEEELAERLALEKSLKENNPKEKAAQLRAKSRRIAAIISTMSSKATLVNGDEYLRLQALAASFKAAKEASEIAARQFKESEPLLEGTGGEAWKELFEAAKKFALESYPESQFPDLAEGSPCPLCQQPLAEGLQRLQRFEAFIQQAAEKTARERHKLLNDAYRTFSVQQVALGIEEETFEEIRLLDEGLATGLRSFGKALVERHEAMKEALKSNDWESVKDLSDSPGEPLATLAAKLIANAETLEKAANEEARTKLQKRFDELDARAKLATVKKQVLEALGCLVHQTNLKACLPAVKPTAISLKSAKITEQVVSAELETALNDEFKALGVNSLSVTLQSRNERGKPRHKLKLELPQSMSPADILSEGEQRAVAISSFLAEVKVSGSKGGIVFDDPMSSLDHRRRERIARRLVAEAQKRQVIVFTHDIFFLCLLDEEAKAQEVSILSQSLIRRPAGFGVSDPTLPFEGQKTSQRVKMLRTMHVDAGRLQKNGDEPAYRQKAFEIYVMLRMAWEYAVEEVLFRTVVLRFRKGVSTQRLAEVEVDDSDYAAIDEGMTRCSNYAHARALVAGSSIPDADDLAADIEALETWRKKVEGRVDETRKRRK